MVPLPKLQEVFERLDSQGYCEEDILEAFISSLEQQRIKEDDEKIAEMIDERCEDLRVILKKWIKQDEDLLDELDIDEDLIDELDVDENSEFDIGGEG